VVPDRQPSIITFFIPLPEALGIPHHSTYSFEEEGPTGFPEARLDLFGLAAYREVGRGHKPRVATDMAGQVRITRRARANTAARRAPWAGTTILGGTIMIPSRAAFPANPN